MEDEYSRQNKDKESVDILDRTKTTSPWTFEDEEKCIIKKAMYNVMVLSKLFSVADVKVPRRKHVGASDV